MPLFQLNGGFTWLEMCGWDIH